MNEYGANTALAERVSNRTREYHVRLVSPNYWEIIETISLCNTRQYKVRGSRTDAKFVCLRLATECGMKPIILW